MLHKGLLVGRTIDLQEKLVVLPLLFQLLLQLASVVDEIEGEAEAQHAQAQESHIDLRKSGGERPGLLCQSLASY